MSKGYNSRFIRRHGEKFGLGNFNQSQESSTIDQSSSATKSPDIERFEALRAFTQLKTIGELRAACPFFNHIQQYLDGDLSEERFGNLIEKLYKKYFKGNSIHGVYFNLALMDRIIATIHLSGIPEGVEVEQYPYSGDLIDGLLIRFLAARILTTEDAQEVTQLREYLQTQGAGKTSMGLAILVETRMAHVFYSQMKTQELQERFQADGFHVEEEKKEYRKINNELFEGIKQLRRYSVASSMYEDGLSHGQGQAWVVMDPVPLRRSSDILKKTFQHVIAAFLFTSESQEIQEISARPWVDTSSRLHMARIDFSFPYDYRYDLGDDGEIYLISHPLKLALRDICTRMSHEGVYELLRFFFITHIFDLVVPREISEQAPSLHNLKKTIENMRQETGESSDVCIRKLVLPRKLILKDRQKVQDAIDRSQEEGHAEVERRTGKKIDHRVGSPVRLREGYKRHPQAVEWAAEHGVVLKDDETWRQPTDPKKPLQKIVYKSIKKISD